MLSYFIVVTSPHKIPLDYLVCVCVSVLYEFEWVNQCQPTNTEMSNLFHFDFIAFECHRINYFRWIRIPIRVGWEITTTKKSINGISNMNPPHDNYRVRFTFIRMSVQRTKCGIVVVIVIVSQLSFDVDLMPFSPSIFIISILILDANQNCMHFTWQASLPPPLPQPQPPSLMNQIVVADETYTTY